MSHPREGSLQFSGSASATARHVAPQRRCPATCAAAHEQEKQHRIGRRALLDRTMVPSAFARARAAGFLLMLVSARAIFAHEPLARNRQRADDAPHRHLRSLIGDLPLHARCYEAFDCAPGLYTMFGVRTQCEVTPFSAGDSVCCKAFSTPCDIDEACCSGSCLIEHARCADAKSAAPNIALSEEDSGQYAAEDPTIIVVATPAPSPPPGKTLADSGQDAAEDPAISVMATPVPSSAPGKTLASVAPYTSSTDQAVVVTEPPSEASPAVSSPPSAATTNDTDENVSTVPPSPAPSTQPTRMSSQGAADSGENEDSTHTGAPSSGTARCVRSYPAGRVDTIAASDERVASVAVDSQGNVFYSLGSQEGSEGSIRRAADFCRSNGSDADGEGGHEEEAEGSGIDKLDHLGSESSGATAPRCRNDELVFAGEGVILAVAVDANDDIVFSMAEELLDNGGIYRLTTPTDSVSSGASDQEAERIAFDLGSFLPGVAVCPTTGDVYASKGHLGLTRIVMGPDNEVLYQVDFAVDEMDLVEDDGSGNSKHAPLMIWGVAVDSQEIVYMTTYGQGVVLKGEFPRSGGRAKVRLAAGTWDSGVSSSFGDGGAATAATLAFPKGVAINSQDNVYIAEFQGARIRSVTPAGIISAAVGIGEQGYSGDGGLAKDVSMSMPNDVAFAPGGERGEMVIADFGNSAVRRVMPSCS